MPAPDFASSFHDALLRHTGFLVSRAGLMAQRHFADHLAQIDLNPRMWGALNVIEAAGPLTQQALGRGVGIDPSTTVATIDELESRGLVERRAHPSDRRAHALYVTDAGRQTLAEGRRVAARAQEELLSSLDQGEREQLHDLLLRIVNSMRDGPT
jgi:DNA-binding MarR family transcriptional regulator